MGLRGTGYKRDTVIQDGGCFEDLVCGRVVDAGNRAMAMDAVSVFVVLWGISFCC